MTTAAIAEHTVPAGTSSNQSELQMNISHKGAAPANLAEREAAIALYRLRASQYDLELVPFEPIRRAAIDHLALKEGDVVLDLGCGTGLSLGALRAAVGDSGRVIGIEQCPDMIATARARVSEQGWCNVELLCTSVEDAQIGGLADAAMFHFTHDVLQKPAALAQVMRHLRPGARVVATGLKWAGAWNWVSNLFVLWAAWYSVTSMEGLSEPWRLLRTAVPDLTVESTWQGAVFIAHGHVSRRPVAVPRG